MTDFHNFKGRAKRLDDIDLPRIGYEIGVGEDELHAFMDVESLGSGFDGQGRPKLLFEPHVFYRNLSGAKRAAAVKAGLAYREWGAKPYPSDSYPRLLKAIAIDETAALLASSWGLTQVLGENFAAAGFSTVQVMVLDFMDDEENHLNAAVKFIVAKGIDDDMRALAALTRPTTPEDCVPIVRVYNGSGFRKNNYHVKFAKAHNKWRGIRDTAFEPPGADPVGVDLYDGGFHTEVQRVQQRLDSLGYPEVGTIDGRWGTKCRAAVLAFRADHGLPLTPTIDNDLLAALMTAEPRPVSEARATATLADLRGMGAEDVKAADMTQLAGGVAAAGGGLGAASKLLDGAEGYSSIAQRALDIIDPFKQFIYDNLWLFLGGVGAIVLWQTIRLKRIRLEKHHAGQDVSK